MTNWMYRSLLLLLALTAWLCSCTASEDPGTGTDGDQDDDPFEYGDPIEMEFESEGEASGCDADSCVNGMYCDQNDGLCKNCTENSHCGKPDPISGITPVCRDGRCQDLVCGSVITVDAPADGANLPVTPPSVIFREDGIMVTDNRAIFPIGIQNLHPDLFDEANTAGANLVISSSNCCDIQQDREYQEQTFLLGLKSADLFGSVRAASPCGDYAQMVPLSLMTSITARSNITSLLFWLAADRPRDCDSSTVAEIAAKVRTVTDDKLVAVAEDWGFSVASYVDTADFFLVSLDPASTAPGAEVRRVSSAAQKPVWARLSALSLDSDALIGKALHAIAAGATGIVFELPDETDDEPAAWSAIKTATRMLRDRTAIWLSPSASDRVELESSSPDLGLHAVIYENKVLIVTVVNGSDSRQTGILVLSPDLLPFCLGEEGKDSLLHLTRETEMNLDLAPGEWRVFQVTEAAQPGDDGGEN